MLSLFCPPFLVPLLENCGSGSKDSFPLCNYRWCAVLVCNVVLQCWCIVLMCGVGVQCWHAVLVSSVGEQCWCALLVCIFWCAVSVISVGVQC